MKAHQSISELLNKGKAMLKENGVAEFSLDAQLFMMEATGISKVELYTKNDYILNKAEKDAFLDMIDKRIKKVPTQYILGRGSFFGLEFKVTPDVLIPRPDTEILVETVLKHSRLENINSIVDVGTGSGCIAISLNKNGINDVTAIDISEKALKIANENAQRNSADIKFIKSNLFKELPEDAKFDAVVSNPPYIVRHVVLELVEEVKGNEPLTALDGGIDGLDFYREITKESHKYLHNKGWIFFEIGYDQGKSVSDLLKSHGFEKVRIIKDLSGLDRVVIGRIVGEV